MALSPVSHVVLPYAQCSSGVPVFQTRHCSAIQFLPSLTRCTSYVRLSKSIIRAKNSENSSHDSRFGNEASNSSGNSRVNSEASNSSGNSRVSSEASNSSENSRVSSEASNSSGNSRVSGEASNSENSVENSRVSNEPSNYTARRTYRKPLASLRVTGEALPVQVNAALAADGGRTAAQELAQGKPMLVIETYSPGRFSEGSTVSTKLQAPTLSVLKRAKSMAKNEPPFSSSGRAFAIAFQAVRLLKLSQFELCFFKPGTTKGMDDYKEGEVVGYLEVFNASTLSEVAKAVCSYALACVKDHADQGVRKAKKQTTTVDSSAVRISTLTESQVLAHCETIVDEKALVGASMGLRRHRSWWERPLATQAVVRTGVDAQLVDEFVPAHALEFKLPSNNFEAVGLQKMGETSCIIHLTHAQMMDLADVLDLYCGDPYTGSGENVSISIDIPRRSWTQVAQKVAVAGLAAALGGALLVGALTIRRARGQMERPPPVESIFDMAFSQKLRELREGEPVDEQTDPVDAPSGDDDDVDLAEQNEAVVDEPVYKSPSRVSFRGRTRYYN